MNKKTIDTKRVKKPWPTKDAMDQVYKMNLWGDNNTPFYSGFGSHDPNLVKPYIDVVASFLKSFKSPLNVCDLGCGDFNIGKELVKYTNQYIGVDVVSDLITHNKEKFKAERLEFQCLDLAKDNLPSGDCALVRQVLQHISNLEVQNIITKLRAYKYVIITEHLPHGTFIPNKDIISGQGIRLKKQSGLNLLEAPFYFKVKHAEILLSVSLPEFKGEIVTTFYEVF